jgi:diphthamide synthase subunit DPH2
MENAFPEGLQVSTMDAPSFIKAAHVSILLVGRFFYANCMIASHPICQGRT